MHRFAVALVVLGALLNPAESAAETSDASKQRIAASLKEVFSFGVQNDVVINGCQVEITSVIRQTCMVGAAKRSQTKIDLSEVEEITLSPFKDVFGVNVELYIPDPNPLKFFFDRLRLGEEEHFRQLSEARKQALSDANLQSGRVLWMCDGEVYPDNSRSLITLIVDRQPSEWVALQQLAAECRNP